MAKPEKGVLYDLSYPIEERPPCTFSTQNKVPAISFEEGDSHGMRFLTSRIDNLHSNTCTHVDFPGHLADYCKRFAPTVGDYPIDRFVGLALVVDLRAKLDPLAGYFDVDGRLAVKPTDSVGLIDFLRDLDSLKVSLSELQAAISHASFHMNSLRGLLFLTGLGRFWRYEIRESWEYAYFFGPFLETAAAAWIVDRGLSFVGGDFFQLEHPIINFDGDEIPLILNSQARAYAAKKLKEVELFSNHRVLLGGDVLIYENLMIPEALAGCVVRFTGQPLNLRFAGLNDNGLVRPFAEVVRFADEVFCDEL